MAKTIAGLYNSFEEARDVRDALVNAGFDRDNISIVAANSDDRYSDFVDENVGEGDYDKYRTTDATHDDDRSHAAEGAVAGGLLAGAGGLILALVVPGAGPLTATGWLVASLIGLAGGAITGGILGALVDAGIDEEDATVYSEGIRRGYALLTVRAEDGSASQVAQIMNDHGAIDTDQRAAYWESTGWEREYDADASAYSTDEIKEARAGYQNYLSGIKEGGTATIPVVEEEMRVGKREVQSGGVRVRTHVESKPVEETVSLKKESVHVDRKAVNREVSPSDIDAFEEGVVEVTATAEEVVTDKVARVVEEVTVSKDVDQVSETVRDTVRHTEVDVDNVGTTATASTMDYDDTAYRSHYQTTYGTTGRDYDYYAPHYQYGRGLVDQSDYAHHSDWNSFENDARRDWETRHRDDDTAWDDVKDAVRSGWNSVKRTVS